MSAFPDVAGRCPSCGSRTLFLGAGGRVTCARLDCPDPCQADELLETAHETLPRIEALVELIEKHVGELEALKRMRVPL